jgi:hypothetical protein
LNDALGVARQVFEAAMFAGPSVLEQQLHPNRCTVRSVDFFNSGVESP